MSYANFEKIASTRIMRALNNVREGVANPRELALLRRRGMPTTQVGARMKQRGMLNDVLSSSGNARVKMRGDIDKNYARQAQMGAKFRNLEQKAYGDSPMSYRLGKSEYKTTAQNSVDKARLRYLGRGGSNMSGIEDAARRANSQILGGKRSVGLSTDAAFDKLRQ